MRWIAPDIFVAPVEENRFNASKSHLKAYEAAMTGAAFVCTDYETYAPLESGPCFKVSNTFTQWRDTLAALIEDSAMRERAAQRLEQYVLDSWHIDNHIHKWVEFYEEVLASPRVRGLEDVVKA